MLDPMFDMLSSLNFRGQRLQGQNFYVMGQICVAREERGNGVFDALYDGHRDYFAQGFDCVVTEVATRNTRSRRAHQRVGFEQLHGYRDQSDEWVIMAWDFSSRIAPGG